MSLAHQQNSWLPPGRLRPPDDRRDISPSVNGFSRGPSRPRTPQARFPLRPQDSAQTVISEADPTAEEDPRVATFRERFQYSEQKIGALFNPRKRPRSTHEPSESPRPANGNALRHDTLAQTPAPPRRAARKLDDDDYDEYDEDDEENDTAQAPPSPKATSASSSGDVKGPPCFRPSSRFREHHL